MNIIEIRRQLSNLSMQNWLNNELLTWNWWIKVIVFTLAIFIFYKAADRKRLHETAIFGMLVSLICTILDIIGTSNVFWNYPIRLLPLEFSEIHDFVIIPIVYMLIYQHYTRWKEFIVINILVSALFAFVAEYVAIWLNFYKEILWKHIYSFPFYFCIAILSKYITDKIVNSKKNL